MKWLRSSLFKNNSDTFIFETTEKKVIDKTEQLDLWLAAGGGFAIRLVKGY